jgi:hypothetical protein
MLASCSFVPAILLLLQACSSESETPADPVYVYEEASAPTGTPTGPVGTADAASTAAPPKNDPLSPTRLLRRASLVLTGAPPSYEALQALEAIPDEAGRLAKVDQLIDQMLASKEFYREVVRFGFDWFQLGDYLEGGKSEGYLWRGDARAYIQECPAGTNHAGAFYGSLTDNGRYPNFGAIPAPWPICNDQKIVNGAIVNQAATVRDVEPWWAPGKTVRVLGQLGSGNRTDPKWGDCRRPFGGIYQVQFSDAVEDNTCSCGPNMVWCTPSDNNNRYNADTLQPGSMARQAWEEPARLLGHIAWQDRPLSDLVLANYTVAPAGLQAMYVGQGRNLEKHKALDDDDSWWKPSKWVGPTDPDHEVSDPLGWRQVVVEKINPILLSLSGGKPTADIERSYKFDPRTTMADPDGIPAAGILTMPISNSTFARERVRAARWLERLACRAFVPPSADAKFNEYAGDPARGGTCRHCHELMDPAAIHFKRMHPAGPGYNSFMGIGPWHLEKMASYEAPRPRIDLSFLPDTVMTPVTKEQDKVNPNAKLIDFLPPDQTMFGQVSDGTIGPLGFAKMLVKSGEFDRCATQKVYERMLGHRLDPGVEKLYIDRLTADFVASGRTYRGLVRALVRSPEFRRGL